jgi:hypothetical protein
MATFTDRERLRAEIDAQLRQADVAPRPEPGSMRRPGSVGALELLVGVLTGIGFVVWVAAAPPIALSVAGFWLVGYFVIRAALSASR